MLIIVYTETILRFNIKFNEGFAGTGELDTQFIKNLAR